MINKNDGKKNEAKDKLRYGSIRENKFIRLTFWNYLHKICANKSNITCVISTNYI